MTEKRHIGNQGGMRQDRSEALREARDLLHGALSCPCKWCRWCSECIDKVHAASEKVAAALAEPTEQAVEAGTPFDAQRVWLETRPQFEAWFKTTESTRGSNRNIHETWAWCGWQAGYLAAGQAVQGRLYWEARGFERGIGNVCTAADIPFPGGLDPSGQGQWVVDKIRSVHGRSLSERRELIAKTIHDENEECGHADWPDMRKAGFECGCFGLADAVIAALRQAAPQVPGSTGAAKDGGK